MQGELESGLLLWLRGAKASGDHIASLCPTPGDIIAVSIPRRHYCHIHSTFV